MEIIAHVLNKDSLEEFELHMLHDHLDEVARLAGKFGESFRAQTWAETAGLLHDWGKYNKAFQQKIRIKSGMTQGRLPCSRESQHAIVGALIARDQYAGNFLPLAYSIAGHHAGIPNWNGGLDAMEQKRDLLDRSCKESPIPPKHGLSIPQLSNLGRDFHHWVRMLFSCLVDADWLDTEAFMDKARAKARITDPTPLGVLKVQFDNYMAELCAQARPSDLNTRRASILAQCRAQAVEAQGTYSLTVPTGGGKTLASMAWALDHAMTHKLDRIIIAIPYTSIITQTAAIYKKIFGEENVIEHHSNIIVDEKNEEGNNPLRLACENWDAPIIVTTNVQLFESLFSNKPSRCRKLHNICRSVLILDEAQMLPEQFLHPVLNSLAFLHESFNCSVLIMSATQPQLCGKIGSGLSEFDGLKHMREIIQNVDELYKDFKRVDIHFPEAKERRSWEEIATELKTQRQVLCIVNTRGDAQQLHELMPEDTIHLSRQMCSAHLAQRIKLIKDKLQAREPIRVISTQLIEAGVDIDFPIVYRAFTGLDSIIQAAGRCNREGKLPTQGQVHVFHPPRAVLQGLMRKSAQALTTLLELYAQPDVNDTVIMRRFFEGYYSAVNSFDEKKIIELLEKDVPHCQFAEAAEAFRLIDDVDSQSILVPYEGGVQMIAQLQEGLFLPDRVWLRRLQQYSVSIHSQHLNQMIHDGLIEQISGIYCLVDSRNYNESTGLTFKNHWLEEILLA